MGVLSEVRNGWDVLRWSAAGMPLPPPPAVKRRTIAGLIARHRLSIFVETGTFKGDTLAFVAARGLRAISIELQPEFFARARARFAGRPNVELHQGDSGDVLPAIVATLTRPALFWLDGHYSAGETAHGALASPISGELAAILDSPVPGHVVLIDDAHEFTGAGGYPPLGALIASIEATTRHYVRLAANMLVIEPR